MVGPVGALLRLGLQLVLFWLEKVFNNGVDQVVQLLLQMRHVAVRGCIESQGTEEEPR